MRPSPVYTIDGLKSAIGAPIGDRYASMDYRVYRFIPSIRCASFAAGSLWRVEVMQRMPKVAELDCGRLQNGWQIGPAA